jgi:UTP-glucose-1-phosphate uridylyltransferase
MSTARPPRQAVLPAAGLGTRFLPATNAVPNELQPVAASPKLQHIAGEAARAGLADRRRGLVRAGKPVHGVVSRGRRYGTGERGGLPVVERPTRSRPDTGPDFRRRLENVVAGRG